LTPTSSLRADTSSVYVVIDGVMGETHTELAYGADILEYSSEGSRRQECPAPHWLITLYATNPDV
jgi:hypothetical protein